jgi:mannose-6-phosphate isomerase-like protein (cupin superfamily)
LTALSTRYGFRSTKDRTPGFEDRRPRWKVSGDFRQFATHDEWQEDAGDHFPVLHQAPGCRQGIGEKDSILVMIHSVLQYTNDLTSFEEPALMEKIVDDERVNNNHIAVRPGHAVPTHVSNSWVQQIVVRGTLSLSLEDEPFSHHPAGSVIAVPFNHKMVIRNQGSEILEFFVVKAPNPRDMPPVKSIPEQ